MENRQLECIKIYKKNNKIIKYKLRTKQDNILYFDTVVLKDKLKKQELDIINLNLTTDNRIIHKGIIETVHMSKTNDETWLETKESIQKTIGKAKFLNRLVEIKTADGKVCYLFSKTEHKHIIYIPSNVKLIKAVYDMFTSKVRNLTGYIQVIGGENLRSVKEIFKHCQADIIDIRLLDLQNVLDDELKGLFADTKVSMNIIGINKIREERGLRVYYSLFQ